MQRRTFLQTSLATACSATAAPVLGADRPEGQIYELRTYSLQTAKQPTLEAYLSKAFLPALKRLGAGPVGVFVEKGKQDQLAVHVFIVYPSADLVVARSSRLDADAEYHRAAHDYLAAPATDPVYRRIDSALLVPIAGMARLEKPDTSKPRLLNLRTYESHNERAAKKKIEMFNRSELAIFRRVGLRPVFFGETIIGPAMPNLTYLLVFPDDAGRTAAWSRFVNDPEWKKLRAIPEYADKEIVSHITNRIVVPTAFSEI
jgi:hypothetical protein